MIPLLRGSFQPLLREIAVEGVDIVAGHILYENMLFAEIRHDPLVDIGLVFILFLYNAGRVDKSGGLTVKMIRDIILVLRLSLAHAYKEKAIPLLNWDMIEYPKELGIKKVVSLSREEEQRLIQCIYLHLNRKTAGILVALMTGVRIGELCGLQMSDISLTNNTITISRTVQRIYDKRKESSYINIGPPKTKSSARTIPIPSLLGNIIKRFMTDNPNHYFLTGKSRPNGQ